MSGFSEGFSMAAGSALDVVPVMAGVAFALVLTVLVIGLSFAGVAYVALVLLNKARKGAARFLRYVDGAAWFDVVCFFGASAVFLVTLAALLFPSVTLPALAGLVRS